MMIQRYIMKLYYVKHDAENRRRDGSRAAPTSKMECFLIIVNEF